MPIYKPTELIQFLEGLGINPKKALSQNFLIDGNVIRKIIKEAQVEPGETILEIGPGPGCLTEALLEAGARVIAVEKDRVLAEALKRFQTPDNRLEIFCTDILEFPIENYFNDGRKGKIIANLPYNIATAIITKLVIKNQLLSKIVVMVQEEVARRITGSPGTKEYGSLSVYLNCYSTPRYAFKVSKNCFIPAPKVESAIVDLTLKKPPTGLNEDDFFLMTRTAFEHRRKMLKASLKKLYPSEDVESALLQLEKNPLSRPEDLSFEDFLELHKILKNKI